ncbi:MAG: F0F1 ATP synthase subunit delta, partial [Stellaceae bacterium]
MASEATSVSGLAKRYAAALFELADERKTLDTVAADLAGLGQLIDDSADLRRMIRSPVLQRDEQARAIGAVAERAGANPLTRNFLGLLAR